MEKVELAMGIYVYKNVLPESLEIIEELEAAVSYNLTEWTPSLVNSVDGGVSNKMLRDTDIIGIPYLGKIDENFDNPSSALYKTLNNIFYEEFTPCEDDYKSMFGIQTEWHDTWSILKYGEGQFFVNHVDDCTEYTRRISTVYYMNDNYEGGEICFSRFNIEFKPEAHDLIIFPSNFLYNHEVKPVRSGKRYAVVGWLR